MNKKKKNKDNKSCLDTLKCLDDFGYKISDNINMNGHSHFKTRSGGCLSIITKLIFVICCILKILALVTYTDTRY